MDLEELLPKMRARVAQCRRLAAATTDERTAAILRAMADEGDADIARLLGEAESAASPKAQPSE